MKDEDIEMRVQFRTHCPSCGKTWMIESMTVVASPIHFKRMVENMRKQLELNPKTCCASRDLPIPGKEWQELWNIP